MQANQILDRNLAPSVVSINPAMANGIVDIKGAHYICKSIANGVGSTLVGSC